MPPVLDVGVAADPGAGRIGACGDRAIPGFNGLLTRALGASAGAVPGWDVEAGRTGVAAVEEVVDVAVCDTVVGGVEGTPRSRSPIFGSDFICSPQYCIPVESDISMGGQ